jgi:hypothetical protein
MMRSQPYLSTCGHMVLYLHMFIYGIFTYVCTYILHLHMHICGIFTSVYMYILYFHRYIYCYVYTYMYFFFFFLYVYLYCVYRMKTPPLSLILEGS